MDCKKMLFLMMLSVLLLIAASEGVKRKICEGNELKDAIYHACGYSPPRGSAPKEEEKAKTHHRRRLHSNHIGQHPRRHHKRIDYEKAILNRIIESKKESDRHENTPRPRSRTTQVPMPLRVKCCEIGCTIIDLLSACIY